MYFFLCFEKGDIMGFIMTSLGRPAVHVGRGCECPAHAWWGGGSLNCPVVWLAWVWRVCADPYPAHPWHLLSLQHHDLRSLKIHMSFFWNNFIWKQTPSEVHFADLYDLQSNSSVVGFKALLWSVFCEILLSTSAKDQLLISWPVTFGLGIKLILLLEWDMWFFFFLFFPCCFFCVSCEAEHVLCTPRWQVGCLILRSSSLFFWE